jgi:hypothetical protein
VSMFGFWRSSRHGAEKRGAARRQLSASAVVRQVGRDVDGTIRDISSSGVQLILKQPPPPGTTSVGVKIDRVGFIPAKVAWAEGNRMGLRFDKVAPAMQERIDQL